MVAVSYPKCKLDSSYGIVFPIASSLSSSGSPPFTCLFRNHVPFLISKGIPVLSACVFKKSNNCVRFPTPLEPLHA